MSRLFLVWPYMIIEVCVRVEEVRCEDSRAILSIVETTDNDIHASISSTASPNSDISIFYKY